MLRCKLVIPVMLLLSYMHCQAQSTGDINSIKRDVTYLASKKLKGREAGTKQELIAAKYIAKRFEEIGLTTLDPYIEYYQNFTFELKESTGNGSKSLKDNSKRTARNVIGYINNNGRNTVVVGAHYDHIGYGLNADNYDGKRLVHQGADDNASGIAAMLLLAERLKAKNDASNNYIFIAFSAEEKGMLGSKYYVENPGVSKSQLNCMINLDMVGRLYDDSVLIITGTGTSPKWTSIINKVNIENVKIEAVESGLGESDHNSFYLKGIPVMNLFTGKHEDYHKPTDSPNKIDYDGIAQVVNYTEKIIDQVDNVLKLAFTSTVDQSQETEGISEFEMNKANHVVLGVLPDSSYVGQGIKINAIMENRPACRAGMQNGDVVKRLGNIEIQDTRSYMNALGQFKQGEKTTVQFDRNGNLMELELEF